MVENEVLNRKIYQAEKLLDMAIYRVLFVFVFVLPLFVIPGLFYYISLAKVILLKIVAGTLLVLWSLFIFSTRRVRWKTSVVRIPLFLFITTLFVSAIASVNPLNSILSSWGERFEELPTWISYFVVFLAALLYKGGLTKTKSILKALVAGSVVSSLHGIFQRFGFDFVKLSWTEQMRSSAFLGNPILLGGYLSMVIPLALGLALAAKYSEEKIFWGIACSLAGLTLIFTLSRGSLLGAVAGVLVLVVFLASDRTYRKQVGIAVLIIVVVGFLGYFLAGAIKAGPSLLSRIEESSAEGSLATRFSIWRSSLRMIAERPWVGWGFENFRNHFSQYREEIHVRLTQGRVLPDRPHNQMLYIFFATGALGLFSYLWLVITLFWYVGARTLRNRKTLDSKHFLLAGSMAAATVAYIVQEQSSFSLPAVTPLFWILAGLLLNSSTLGEERNEERFGPIAKRPVLIATIGSVIAIILLASALVIGYADFSYYRGLKAYIEQGNPLEAENLLKEAIRLNPLKGEYRLALGRVYRRLSYQTENPVWIKKAIDIYQKGIVYDPDSPNLYLGLGEAYYAEAFLQKKKDYTLVKQTLIQGLIRLPYSEDGRVLLAESLIQEGNLDAAQKQLSYVLDYSPSDFQALYNMGVVLEAKGDFPSAIDYFQRALEVRPESLETREKLKGLGANLR